MKLISCHVENFGRLHDFDYVFSDEVNVICKENGWGKSTFAAFLLAMFYGLPGKGKTGRASFGANAAFMRNARAAYRPWQGGVFGGQLVFEAGGRAYEMTRIFGDREAQDEFDLRDFETNLPSFDYSKNVGKELFMLDRESFLRTVFTSQQDCVTETTDDINALVADLAENAGDMESYEGAQKRLKDAANGLTPDRTTGKINRMDVKIRQLEQRTAASADLEERIIKCTRELKDLEEKKGALDAERVRLANTIASMEEEEAEAARRERAGQSLMAKQQIWRQLYRANARRRDELQRVCSYFPGPVPTRAEVDALLQNCREMERLEARMQTEMLTGEEQERLTYLEERFAEVSGQGENGLSENSRSESKPTEFGQHIGYGEKGLSAEGSHADSGNKRQATAGRNRGAGEKRVPAAIEHRWKFFGGIALFLAGAALLLMTVGMNALKGIPLLAAVILSLLLITAGAGLTVIGAVNRSTAAGFQHSKQAGNTSGHLDQARQKSPGTRTGSADSQSRPDREERGSVDSALQGEETDFSYDEYLYLEKKERKVEKTHADWAEVRRPILRFLKDLGLKPQKDLHSQLTSIRDAADDCEDAQALLREAGEELRLFEEELRRSGLDLDEFDPAGAAAGRIQEENHGETNRKEERKLIREKERKPKQNIETLRQRREQAHEEILRCRAQAVDAERRMAELSEEREERDAMLEELKDLREQREKDMADYRHIIMASDLLQKARESLTARYADPIRIYFCRYWEMITGYSASGVYVDADSNVTVEERGKQRDAVRLSTGWRDLAGICLRTALADAMYPPDRREKPPLILDDPFTNLDDEKMEGAMRFLKETGRHYQILYFTCSSTRC